ncbi:hypothetical protein [Chryseobacterium sp. SIMBA_028]|uniref:hypothetical protein n=2 Tax=Bacteria TaxID=2 RepID=UPI00397D6D9F
MNFLKKIAKLIAITFITVIASVFIFTIIIKRIPAEKYNQLDQTDKEMFDELTVQYKIFNQSPDHLWTSAYHYDKEPLILIRSDKNKSIWNYIYLINASKLIDTTKYKKIHFPNNPYLTDVYATTSLGLTSLEYWFPSAFTYTTLDNKQVLAFKYYPELFKKEFTFPDFKYFSMHEAFHLYAQKNWLYDHNSKDYIANYPYTKEHFNLLDKEYALLDKGLKTTDPEQLDIVMKQWVEIRNIRYKKWPQLLGETYSEAIEGTARYLEYKYSDMINEPRYFITNNNGDIISFTQGLQLIQKNPESYSFLERNASYDKGAALGYILDRLDPLWKNKIEDSTNHKGLTQYQILKSRYF